MVTFDGTVWDIRPGKFHGGNEQYGGRSYKFDGFFGLPAGTLQSFKTNGTLTDGSAIYQDFFANAVDTVTMYWEYVARDNIPFNDPAHAVVIPPNSTSVEILASIYSGGRKVGSSSHSTWQEFTFTAAETGNHRLGFAVTNDRDTVPDAAFFLDSEQGGHRHTWADAIASRPAGFQPAAGDLRVRDSYARFVVRPALRGGLHLCPFGRGPLF